MQDSKLVGKTFNWALCAVAAGTLAACGGGGESVVVATADVPVVVSASTASTAKAVIAAVAATPVTFPGAVSLLGTSSATTFTLAPTGASNAAADIGNFQVADRSGNSYSGAIEPGSCILVIKVSSFQPPSPYAVGGKITVNPCSFTAKVAGTTANGTQSNREVVVTLGTATTAVTLPVTVAANGQVSFGSNVITTVPVQASTGGNS